jgi:terminal uridylyltransferase
MAAVVLPEVEISPEEIAEKQAFRQSLEDLCNEAMAATFKESNVALFLKPYGSLASGLALKGADMDLAITVTGKLPSATLKLLPRLLEWAILFAGHGARVIDKTRVPIIKVCEAPHAELYDALLAEREKWEVKQDEEILAHGEWMGIPDMDIGSGTRTNDSTAHASVGSSASPDQLALSYLHDFVMQERTDSDSVVLYNETFQRIARPLLLAGSLDLSTACDWYADGLPPSTQAAVRNSKKFNFETPPPNGLEVLLNLAMSHSALLGLRATAGTSPRESQTREEKRHALDFPSTGVGILCDINFSNELALHNTRLLYCYTLCDPRVRPMILLVKTWAKRRKINSPYDGTLSSYGYVLMVLHFLMNIVRPPILPNLQQHHYATHPGQHIFVQNWDVAFCDDENYIRASAASGKLTENKDTLGVLLRNFFLYYAHAGGHTSIAGGFNWKPTVLALRVQGGILSKEWKGWTAARVTTTEDNVEVKQRYLFAIEDPFELDHNVARTVTHNGFVAIGNEFRRAWRILAAVGYGTRKEGDVFDELVFAVPEATKEGEGSSRGAVVVEGKGQAKVVEAETEEVEASCSGTVVEREGNTEEVEEETEE